MADTDNELDDFELEFENEEGKESPPLTRQQRRLRARRDGFTPAKQRRFLKALAKYGTVKDACGKVGITTTSAYRTRRLLPAFARQWDDALAMAGTELEAVAFKRAVEGVEEKVIRGGKVVQIKVKPSDSMLRTMLQGTNPAKYGGTMGRTPVGRRRGDKLDMDEVRRVIHADVRKRIEKEEEERVNEELERLGGLEATRERIMRKFKAMRQREIDGGYCIEAPNGTVVHAGHALLRFEDVPPGTPVIAALAPRPDLWPRVHLAYASDGSGGSEEWIEEYDGAEWTRKTPGGGSTQ